MTRTLRRGDGWVEPRIRRDGSVAYQARWHDGARWRARTFATEDAAEDHLRQIGRRKRAGAYTPDAELTFADVVDDYLERGASRWRPVTVATYRTIRDRELGGRLGATRVTELTPRTMQLWMDGLARRYGPARLELIRAVATGALKEAMRLGIIDRNPLAGVRLPRKGRTEPPRWLPGDVAMVLAVTRDDPLMHAYYAVSVTTGMRPGEVRALAWADLDAAAGTLTVRRTMTRDAAYRPVIGDRTKTGNTRVIALPAATLAALRRLRVDQAARRLAADRWRDLGLVFDRGDGNALPQQTVQRRHAALIARLGLPALRLHDLRHLAATTLLEAGVDVTVVAALLGHADTATTRDIYQHITERLRTEARDALSAALGLADGLADDDRRA